MDKTTLLKTLTETRAAWEALLDQIDEEQNKDRPLHDIVNEERRAYTALFEAVQMLSDEDLNDPHHFKNMPQEWRPWQLIAGNSFKHYEDHMPSIRQWLEKKR
jgi:Protein of unknown function (DUF1706)